MKEASARETDIIFTNKVILNVVPATEPLNLQQTDVSEANLKLLSALVCGANEVTFTPRVKNQPRHVCYETEILNCEANNAPETASLSIKQEIINSTAPSPRLSLIKNVLKL